MNAAAPLTIILVASGTSLTAIGAESGQRTVGPPSQTDAWSASSRYTPWNGYFGDLSLIAGSHPRASADELALAKSKERTLEALRQALLAREAAIEARLRNLNAENEAQVKALRAEREAIRTREKQVREMLDQATARSPSPAKEATPPERK